jgi:5'-3' exoribonuclease 2
MFGTISKPSLVSGPDSDLCTNGFLLLVNFNVSDFLPHLPSLDIRDGALDYLINVYKRILPSLGDYITNHGGQVNLSHVDVILAEVGSIEDYVFSMKYENEQKDKERREQFNARKKQGNGRNLDAPPPVESSAPRPKAVGRSAKILEQQQEKELASKNQGLGKIKSSHMKSKDNLQAALALKQSLNGGLIKEEKIIKKSIFADLDKSEDDNMEKETSMTEESDVKMETIDEEVLDEEPKRAKRKHKDTENESGIGMVGDAEEEFDEDDDEDEELDPIKIEIAEEISPEVAAAFKERVKNEQTKKLDEYAKAVDDKVRLHEKGWKDRYYSDKCKADDVENHGGREHLFKSYIVGLCWVMKYYYEGCKYISHSSAYCLFHPESVPNPNFNSRTGPSWKWYYPFHYAPFASDLRNIERFQSDVKSFELATPFNPVEQLMAVLPSDSSHAIPKAARWLMEDLESPIIDFYPKEVPVDPNGKAMPWLWVVLLPFIDEDRLLSAL